RVDRDALLCKGWAGAAPVIFGILSARATCRNDVQKRRRMDATPLPKSGHLSRTSGFCPGSSGDCSQLQACRHTTRPFTCANGARVAEGEAAAEALGFRPHRP